MSGSRRPSTSREPCPSLLNELFEALADIYREADLAFSGWSCPASTECCRFGITGREPYVTSIELAAIDRAIAARGGPRALRRAKPSGATAREVVALRVVVEERRCPMLTDEGRCAIYASRPLGCRTFYCDRASAGERVRHRDINALVRRVQQIAARHQPDGDRGRPLTRAFGG
jgi:Fe-S-cluster containining protein